MNNIRIKMFKVQMNVIFMRADTATFSNFNGHRTRDHIT